jgi:hypothetical protein
MLIRGDPSQQLMLIKEQTRTRSKIFHICDPYDIASIKAQREIDEALGNLGVDRKSAFSAQPIKRGGDDNKSQDGIEEEGKDLENPLDISSTFINKAHAIAGSLSVINFVKTKLSYEFSSKHMEATETLIQSQINAGGINANTAAANAEHAREQNILKKVMGLKQDQTMMQTISNFFSEKIEEVEPNQANVPQNEVVRKIKSCSVCKIQKNNHIVREFVLNQNQQDANLSQNLSAFGLVDESKSQSLSFSDTIRQQMGNLAQRDVIEQIIFDPQHGIVKREIHFGIIDYLTSYPMKKRLDELHHLNHPNSPLGGGAAVRPSVYSERFLATMRKIFE